MTLRKREADDSTLTRQVSYVEPQDGLTAAEDWAKITDFMDSRVRDTVQPSDVFTFRLIACSDGLDSYYTRHDMESGLKHFERDLRAGQAVLGNHDYGTFSYGTSYDASIVAADARMAEYEPTAYRKYADNADLITKNWVVGKYYIPRGVELNGQRTDDLIRAMEMGAVRKTSISFMVGRYECSIDKRDLLDGWEMLFDPDASDGDIDDACWHFPGVTYTGDLCYATMYDEDLHETSMVFKNASPSSMYLRKAEGMAQRGMLAASDRLRIEERIGQRLPDPQRRIWTPASKEGLMTVRHETEAGELPAEEQPAPEGTPPETPQETPAEPATEEAPAEQTPEGTVVTEEVIEDATPPEVAEAAAEMVEGGADTMSTDDQDRVAESIRRMDTALSEAGYERTVSAEITRRFEARSSALEEVLGKEPTVEVIRSLQSEAELGRTMTEELIQDVIAERTRAQAEGFDASLYRRTLTAAATTLTPQEAITYLRGEKTSWADLKAKRFTPGRGITPAEPPASSGRQTKLPDKPDDRDGQENVFGQRTKTTGGA